MRALFSDVLEFTIIFKCVKYVTAHNINNNILREITLIDLALKYAKLVLWAIDNGRLFKSGP